MTGQKPDREQKREQEKAGGREPVSQEAASCARPDTPRLDVERVRVVELFRSRSADADGESASCRSLVNAQSRGSIAPALPKTRRE